MNSEVNQIPLRDFFKNPEKSALKLSPNGKHIAYLAPYESRMNIFVQEVDKETSIRVTSEMDRNIDSFTWATDDRILYLKDKSGDENFHIFSVAISGESPAIDITPFESVRAGIIDDLDHLENEILVSLNKRNPQIFDIYKLDIISGEMEMVAENPGNVVGWITDNDGEVRVAMTSDGVNNDILYRPKGETEFKNVQTLSFRDKLVPLFFTANNDFVYALSNLGRDKIAVVIYDIQNGREVAELYSHPEVDVSNAYYSKVHKTLAGAYYTTWKMEQIHFNEYYRQIYKKLHKHLGNDIDIFITSKNAKEDQFLVLLTSDRLRSVYYFYDANTDEIKKLLSVSPWLNSDDLAEMKPISYTSRDGLKINGYLTLPLGKEAKDLPVVVNPHGGPWYRDEWRFNPEVQFLANRGYAVLQMNFRGSTGYGRKFWEASFKQWGLTMQDDITDGVNWLVKEGIADPKRVAIYGGSYGGYATLAGLAFTPDLYACGIDFVGVSNLFSFMKTIPPYWKPMLDMMYEMVGHPENDEEAMRATSPVFHVDKIKAPVFVVQGAKDPRVNINESNQIVEALRARNVEVDYMVKENEGHGFYNQENRFEFYEAVEQFLKKHLHN